MSVQSKSTRKSHLKPDVVMTLFLHETLAIRNLTTRIQELDQKLAREFATFNRISESIENENSQILDLLLEPIIRSERLEKARSQQQRDIARSFGSEEHIGRLLEARSDAISDIARQNMHWEGFGEGLGPVRIDLDTNGASQRRRSVLASGHRPKGDALLGSWVRRSGHVQ
jgi:hypothetical protein